MSTLMKITDRPGRYAAIFIITPLLLICAFGVRSCNPRYACILVLIAVSLFFYELFWISRNLEEVTYVKSKEIKESVPQTETEIKKAEENLSLCT